MDIAILLIVAVVLLAILSCCKVSSRCAREEEKRAQQASPCESCLRWAECNGVDENCPHRKGAE